MKIIKKNNTFTSKLERDSKGIIKILILKKPNEKLQKTNFAFFQTDQTDQYFRLSQRAQNQRKILFQNPTWWPSNIYNALFYCHPLRVILSFTMDYIVNFVDYENPALASGKDYIGFIGTETTLN